MIDAITLSIDVEAAERDDRSRQAVDRGWSSVILHHCGEADAAACERLDAAARRAVNSGLTVRAVMLEPDARSGLGESDPERPSHAVDRITEWLTRTDRIGAATLIVRVAALDRPGLSVRYQDALNAAAWLLDALRRPIECSDASLALIVASGGFLLSPPEARELIDRAGSPHVGVCLWMGSGMYLHTAEDWIQTMGRRLFAVHVSAEGAWSAARNALVSSGFGGILSASAISAAKTADPEGGRVTQMPGRVAGE